VLLLEFASYIWFFYYTRVVEEKIPNAKPALAAPGLLRATLSTHVANENQSLKELRCCTRSKLKNKRKQLHAIYTIISILIFSIIALVFASIYLVEAVHAPSKALKLSERFNGLVVKPFRTGDPLITSQPLPALKRRNSVGYRNSFGWSIRISLFVFPLCRHLGVGPRN
jgi:hypothetical protein